MTVPVILEVKGPYFYCPTSEVAFVFNRRDISDWMFRVHNSNRFTSLGLEYKDNSRSRAQDGRVK